MTATQANTRPELGGRKRPNAPVEIDSAHLDLDRSDRAESIPATPAPEPLAFSVEAAANAASVSATTIKQQIAAGRLRARKVGRRTVVLRDDLKQWLDSLPETK